MCTSRHSVSTSDRKPAKERGLTSSKADLSVCVGSEQVVQLRLAIDMPAHAGMQEAALRHRTLR